MIAVTVSFGAASCSSIVAAVAIGTVPAVAPVVAAFFSSSVAAVASVEDEGDADAGAFIEEEECVSEIESNTRSCTFRLNSGHMSIIVSH